MKRVFTLSLILISFFQFPSYSQTCNAVFSYTNPYGTTVNFLPQQTDSPAVRHKWTFGDGTYSEQVSPQHWYQQNGTYTVIHTTKRLSNNGVVTCIDSAVKFVTVPVTVAGCNLNSNFSWQVDPNNSQKIFFTNTTTGQLITDTVRWDFGDGTFSYGQVAEHIYTNPGTYTVCLRVKRHTAPGGQPCVSEICKVVVVQPTCNLVAYFTMQTSSANPLTVTFTNASTPLSAGDSIRWTFGDGTSSFDINPVHTYTTSGTYTVCLRVKKNNSTNCVREYCKTITVTAANNCNMQPSFSHRIDSFNNKKVYFQNTSFGFAAGDSIRWSFGDGTFSYDVNPTHIYATNGSYNVCLWIKKPATAGTPACVREVCKIVLLSETCNLLLNFSWRSDSINNRKVYFTNNLYPVNTADSIRWTFGDGTSSTELNPVHEYAQTGAYQVCLTIKKVTPNGTVICTKMSCKTISVLSPCNVVANFTTVPDSLQSSVIHFINSSAASASNTSVKWTFGDGTYGYTWNADHAYAQPGTYNVCLRIQTSSTCVREICKTITIAGVCNRPVSFVSYPDQNNPLKLYFTNTTSGSSNGTIAKWTFGDGTTSNGWNSMKTYAAPGRYKVCLRIEFFPGCVKEICDSVTVLAGTNCMENSKWISTQSTVDCLRFKFEPLHKNSTWQYRWTFGDGTGSQSMIPEHKYTTAGNYTVCLTVFKSVSCASTTCGTVTTGNCVNCDSVTLKYTYVADPSDLNKLSFTAVSNHPVTQQVWTITRLPINNSSAPVILSQPNPTYTFGDTGYYRVCLRAYTAGQCVKEYCEVIRIGTLSNINCILQAYPNPVQNIVNVNVSLNSPLMIHAYIYNSLNVLVKEKQQQGVGGNNVFTMNVETLVPGAYTMRIIYGNQICTSQFQKL